MYIFYISSYYNILLNILTILALICGLFCLINKNPIISLLYLIGLFLSISLYLITLDIVFIGISYLLVYIGAVSILFLFILMLIDIRISELHENSKNSMYLGLITSVLFCNLIFTIMYIKEINTKYTFSTIFNDIKGKLYIYNKENINYIYYNNWENSMLDNYDLSNLGNILYTNHSILLILALLILLLAMVGAIKINIK